MPLPQPPKRRYRKPFDQLSRAQKHARKKEAIQLLAQLGVPLHALGLTTRAPAIHALRLTGAQRLRMRRSGTGAQLVGEKELTRLRLSLATTHGTGTSTFTTPDGIIGSYVTDPLVFFEAVAGKEPQLLLVGGDYGGGALKLGVTYLDSQPKPRHTFAALLVCTGSDDYASLLSLCNTG